MFIRICNLNCRINLDGGIDVEVSLKEHIGYLLYFFFIPRGDLRVKLVIYNLLIS